MTETTAAAQLHDGLMAGLFFGGPLVLCATLIGLGFAILQATTQIQDSTLPQIVKMAVLVVLLFAFGDTLSGPLVDFAAHAFSMGR